MNKQTQTADAQTIAFYKRYTKELQERLTEAHEQIGGLQYYLEKNGIDLPRHLAEKKSHNTAMAVALAKINPKILLGDFSLN